MAGIKIHNRDFVPYLSQEAILSANKRLAGELTADLSHENPLFLPVLNGSFIFAADLIRMLDFPLQVNFVKLASYLGTSSSGKVKTFIGINPADVHGKTVVIVEDIVDTGLTIHMLCKELRKFGAADVRICTLLFKPDNYQGQEPVSYTGFEIPSTFVVGYGLDFDGLGRNLNQIYQLKKD